MVRKTCASILCDWTEEDSKEKTCPACSADLLTIKYDAKSDIIRDTPNLYYWDGFTHTRMDEYPWGAPKEEE